jgi:hypothetical protein
VLSAYVALLLVGADVGLRIDDARGVSNDDVAEICGVLGKAIEDRAKLTSAIDAAETSCTRADRCIEDLRARTGATDILFIRFLGVPTRIRLLIELFPLRATVASKTVELDLTRTRSSWAATLAGVAAELFPKREQPVAQPARSPELQPPPEKTPPEIAVAPTSREPEEEDDGWIPWAVIGTGVVVGAVGIGFGVSSRNARSEAISGPHTDAENAALEDRAIGHGIAANVMFVGAAIAIGAGVVLELLDD